MTQVRIAAVVVALLSAQLSAQPVPLGNVTIQVTDTSGAVIPGARIEVGGSPSNPGPVQETDRQGRAVLDLPVGVHTLSITAPGFETLTLKIDVKGEAGQAIVAALRVASYSGPTRVEVEPYFLFDSDLQTKLARSDILIPPRPLLNLAPLTPRPMKKRW